MSPITVRKCRIGQLCIKYEHRSKDSLWGRFGGGWNWKVGIQVGSRTVILSLLVATLRFTFAEREKEPTA